MNNACLAGTCLILGLFPFDKGAGDLVKFPTGLAAWRVEITPMSSGNAGATTGAHIVKIDVVQDDEKRRNLVTWSQGSVMEQWEIYRYNLILRKDPMDHAFATSGVGDSTDGGAISHSPASFRWLASEFLQEKTPIDYKGRKCFHYKGTIERSVLNGVKDDTAMLAMEAWIDSKTLLPVAYEDGTGLGTFIFLKPPSAELQLPAPFQKVLDGAKAGMGVMNPVKLR